MPVTYSESYLVPAPFVSVSKEYVKSSDGKKVGATYSISLEGTIIPHLGSPFKDGTFSKTTSDPDGEYIDVGENQIALQNKAAGIRKLFSTEGKKLYITSWLDDGTEEFAFHTSWHCFPRVTGIDIQESSYSKPMPYVVTLEVDEIFQGDLGEEDWDASIINESHEVGETFNIQNQKCYLSDVQEDWSIDNAGQAKNMGIITGEVGTGGVVGITGHDETPTYNVSHTISAVGKRAYDKDGLVREPWKNAKKWVLTRVGPDPQAAVNPVDFQTPKEILGEQTDDVVDWGGLGLDVDDYRIYNHIRSQSVDITSGSFSITETWLMAADEGRQYDALEDVSMDMSYDFATDTHSLTINGNITGLEVRGQGGKNNYTANSYDSEAYFRGKYHNAVQATKGYTNDYCKNALNDRYVLKDKDGEDAEISTQPISESFSHNEAAGTITFSKVFNTRKQNINGSITESIVINDTNATWQVAQVQVPGRAKGPVLQDMGTRNVASRTVSLNAQLQAGDVNETPGSDGRPNYDVKIFPYRPTTVGLGTIEWKTADQETWEPWSGRYSRTVTWNYQ